MYAKGLPYVGGWVEKCQFPGAFGSRYWVGVSSAPRPSFPDAGAICSRMNGCWSWGDEDQKVAFEGPEPVLNPIPTQQH